MIRQHGRGAHALRRMGIAGLVIVSVAAGASTPARVAAKEIAGPHALAVDERSGRVFVAGNSFTGPGAIGVFDAANGRLLRAISLRPAPTAVAVDERTGRAFALAGQPYFGGPGGAAGAEGRVAVLDATTGRLLRVVPVGERPLAMAVDEAAARVFVVADGATGDGYAARLTALDAASGAVARTVALDNNPEAVGVDERTGRVFVAGDYRTDMLDARSGALLRGIVVGNHPRDVLVDDKNGRVFVVGDGGTVDVLDGRTGAELRNIVLDNLNFPKSLSKK